MINDSKIQLRIQKIKQDLLILRDGKTRSGRKIPDSIRNEIIKLNKLGLSVYQLEKELQLASSAIYRWLKDSKTNDSKNDFVNPTVNSTSKVSNNSSAIKIKKPKQLKIVEDVILDKPLSSISSDLIQLELRSGVKLNISQKQLSLELLSSLNSL